MKRTRWKDIAAVCCCCCVPGRTTSQERLIGLQGATELEQHSAFGSFHHFDWERQSGGLWLSSGVAAGPASSPPPSAAAARKRLLKWSCSNSAAEAYAAATAAAGAAAAVARSVPHSGGASAASPDVAYVGEVVFLEGESGVHSLYHPRNTSAVGRRRGVRRRFPPGGYSSRRRSFTHASCIPKPLGIAAAARRRKQSESAAASSPTSSAASGTATDSASSVAADSARAAVVVADTASAVADTALALANTAAADSDRSAAASASGASANIEAASSSTGQAAGDLHAWEEQIQHAPSPVETPDGAKEDAEYGESCLLISLDEAVLPQKMSNYARHCSTSKTNGSSTGVSVSTENLSGLQEDSADPKTSGASPGIVAAVEDVHWHKQNGSGSGPLTEKKKEQHNNDLPLRSDCSSRSSYYTPRSQGSEELLSVYSAPSVVAPRRRS